MIHEDCEKRPLLQEVLERPEFVPHGRFQDSVGGVIGLITCFCLAFGMYWSRMDGMARHVTGGKNKREGDLFPHSGKNWPAMVLSC